MKICIAQTKSRKGAVHWNIQHHLRMVELALASNPDLVFFPELSITGYEPALAKQLAVRADDPIFLSLQASAIKIKL